MLDDVSLWYVLPAVFAGMFASCLVGQFLSRRLEANRSDDDDSKVLDGFVVSGVFGLMALLMGFSYSLAISRFEERRADVVEEANAISTMYSRLALLPATQRAELESDLAAYTQARVEWGRTQTKGELGAATERTDAMGDRFGEKLFGMIRDGSPDPRTASLIGAYNAMSDMAATRHAVRLAQLPGGVIFLLAMFLFGASIVLGFTTEQRKARSLLGSGLLLALLALAFTSILDLDRPARGTFQVPQDEMIRLAQKYAG